MPKTKVKRDEHGLYVRQFGIIARPMHRTDAPYVFGRTETDERRTSTKFKEGDVVRVSQSSMGMQVKPEWDTSKEWYNPNIEIWTRTEYADEYSETKKLKKVSVFFIGKYVSKDSDEIKYAFTIWVNGEKFKEDCVVTEHWREHLDPDRISNTTALKEILSFMEKNGLNKEKIFVFVENELLLNRLRYRQYDEELLKKTSEVFRELHSILQNFEHISFWWIPERENGDVRALLEKCSKKEV